MPTDTFSIASAADDGCGYRFSTTGWGDVPTSAFTAFDNDASNTIYVSKSHYPVAGQYEVDNIFLRFDTSSIPDTATITGANLLVYVVDIADTANDNEYAADFYDFGGEASVAADWELSSSGDAIASIDPDSLTEGIVNTIALTGLSGINKSGYTGIRIAPQDTSEPMSTGDDWIGVASQEHASQEPRLEVTYATAATGVPIAWIRG